MMYNLESLTNIIVLRNFLVLSIDNLRIRIGKDDLKTIQQRIVYLDKILIDAAVNPNFPEIIENENNNLISPSRICNVIKSGDDIKTVADKVRNGYFDGIKESQDNNEERSTGSVEE